MAQVLCKEGQFGVASYWEVEWRGGGWIDVGVTYQGIGRKGGGKPCLLGRNENSWRLRCTHVGYAAWHDNRKTTVAAPPCPRIGVFLERQKGSLSFYSVSDTVVLLHTFHCHFSQPLYPAFRLDLDSTMLICPHEGGHVKWTQLYLSLFLQDPWFIFCGTGLLTLLMDEATKKSAWTLWSEGNIWWVRTFFFFFPVTLYSFFCENMDKIYYRLISWTWRAQFWVSVEALVFDFCVKKTIMPPKQPSNWNLCPDNVCLATIEIHCIAKIICSPIQIIGIRCSNHFHGHRCIKWST